MKNIVAAVLLLTSSLSQAETPVVRLPLPPQFFIQASDPTQKNIPTPLVQPHNSTKFDFQFVSVSQVVNLIYSEMLKEPFVIDPEVLLDSRSVSFRYESSKGDVRTFIHNFFNSLGIAIARRDGVDFIFKKKIEEIEDTKELFLYRPKFRSVAYLTSLLQPLLKGSFTVRRAVQSLEPVKTDSYIPPSSAASLVDQNSDVLLYSGSIAEVDMMRRLLPQIDVRAGEVMVRGIVYEVSSGNKDGSGFSLALNLLGGKLSMANGAVAPVESFVRFKNSTIDAVFSALSSDDRFKVVSTPSLRVKSGESGRFMVGSDVRVPGSISYPGSGQAPVQSIENLSSGVIFDLLPTIRDSIVDLNISQQLSNFTVTQSGSSSYPTVNKREVKTVLSMNDGEVVLIGGLAETKQTESTTGLSFLPMFMRSKTQDSSTAEIILILQLTKI
ncbi:type II secretion system protein GspD [Herbaspirillum sp. NPDC101397]|uniref:type II secretion system protein GspD n=1 Tax=Herbaspirillum sp. NPDC101397 TaxID=3364006 RepID=UPI00383BE90E